MRDTLIIDGAVLLRNCKIKPVGYGEFLHVKSTPELESLLHGHHIIFTTLQSKFYTGGVSIYKYDEDTFCINLDDIDCDALREKGMRRISIESGLTIIAVYLAVFLIVWFVH